MNVNIKKRYVKYLRFGDEIMFPLDLNELQRIIEKLE